MYVFSPQIEFKLIKGNLCFCFSSISYGVYIFIQYTFTESPCAWTVLGAGDTKLCDISVYLCLQLLFTREANNIMDSWFDDCL